MSAQFFKAVRYDYASFHDPEFTYGPVGTVTHHPAPVAGSTAAADYLSVSTVATDCTGFSWRIDGKDSRLLVVEATGEVWTQHPGELPSKRAVTGVRVVGELPITAAFGEHAAQLLAYMDALGNLSPAAWVAARDAAQIAAQIAARDAARDAARVAGAIIVRDLITPEQFAILTRPMRAAGINFDTLGGAA